MKLSIVLLALLVGHARADHDKPICPNRDAQCMREYLGLGKPKAKTMTDKELMELKMSDMQLEIDELKSQVMKIKAVLLNSY